MQMRAWRMHEAGQPMRLDSMASPTPADGQVLVRVVGCGVCHTDLGFFYEGIRTVKSLPLTLGHEISGMVEQAGPDVTEWIGRPVIVPAVLPCGNCELCAKGRGTICRRQQMPGNHVDGGFASHLVVPARDLCVVDVDDETAPFADSGVTLRELAVVADAVTTPYQAVKDCEVGEGDVAVFVGAGGIGAFGVQIAKALGATVIAVDINDRRLDRVARHGADLTVNSGKIEPREIRRTLRDYVKQNSLNPFEWKILECSGTASGQQVAFGLLTHGATLGVVGFTLETIQLRLSNLMAFDARAIGNWGCHPRYYPEALELVAQGRIKLRPFVESFALDRINEVFDRLHRRELDRRPILFPDSLEETTS